MGQRTSFPGVGIEINESKITVLLSLLEGVSQSSRRDARTPFQPLSISVSVLKAMHKSTVMMPSLKIIA